MPVITPTLSYVGIRALAVSMLASTALYGSYDEKVAGGSAKCGQPLSITADGEVSIAADGGELFGQLQNLEYDGVATVQDSGYAIFDFTGSITYGGGLVGSATPGKVKTGTSRTCIAIASAGAGKVVCKFLG